MTEAKRTAAIAALTNESRSWLRNSLEHNRKEFMVRASRVRRRFAGSTTNAQYEAASELIGQVYDEAAWAFGRALEELLGPGGLANEVMAAKPAAGPTPRSSDLYEAHMNTHVFKAPTYDGILISACDRCGEQFGARYVRTCPAVALVFGGTP